LLLLAIYLAREKCLSKPKTDYLIARLCGIPDAVQATLLGVTPQAKKLAKRYCNARNIYLIGRGIGYPIALEGALKLKEITYIHSEAMPAGELKHGTLALIDRGTPVVAVVPPGESRVRMAGNIEEVKARGATVIAVADEGDEVKKHADEFIPIPPTEELFSPLLYIIPFQLLAYHTTVERGQDPDRPRSLAKSVTVE
jgi:glucosamine--fructose-6-phosphate aminotransferase (isomerizing)